MNTPPTVSPQEWEAARLELLVEEKALTRARDALAAKRRRPRMAVDKEYEFDGPEGKASLLDLFEGRRQLIVYRFFYEPGVVNWPEGGCPGCSMVRGPGRPSRAPERPRHDARVCLARAAAGDRALEGADGWEPIPWYTITDDFDADFGVDEWHGTNAFIRDGEGIYRTYLITSRGDEHMGSTWSYLDITALGRQEEWEDSPEGYPQTPRTSGGGSTTTTGRRPARGSRDPTRRRPCAPSWESPVRGRAVIAHVGGVPVEETLLPLVSGSGAGLTLARAWVVSRVRRRRRR